MNIECSRDCCWRVEKMERMEKEFAWDILRFFVAKQPPDEAVRSYLALRNVHRVRPMVRGRRLVLAMWFTCSQRHWIVCCALTLPLSWSGHYAGDIFCVRFSAALPPCLLGARHAHPDLHFMSDRQTDSWKRKGAIASSAGFMRG